METAVGERGGAGVAVVGARGAGSAAAVGRAPGSEPGTAVRAPPEGGQRAGEAPTASRDGKMALAPQGIAVPTARTPLPIRGLVPAVPRSVRKSQSKPATVTTAKVTTVTIEVTTVTVMVTTAVLQPFRCASAAAVVTAIVFAMISSNSSSSAIAITMTTAVIIVIPPFAIVSISVAVIAIHMISFAQRHRCGPSSTTSHPLSFSSSILRVANPTVASRLQTHRGASARARRAVRPSPQPNSAMYGPQSAVWYYRQMYSGFAIWSAGRRLTIGTLWW